MTIQAQYWVHVPGHAPAEQVARLTTAEDVQGFVTVLSGEHVSDAVLTHTGRPRIATAIPDDDDPSGFVTVPDHSVIVGVHGDRAAMSYRGHDGHGHQPVPLYSHGDGPDHPTTYETDEFPPSSEVPVDAVRAALVEFLGTGARPTNLAWQVAPG